jgi:hypothetical protein
MSALLGLFTFFCLMSVSFLYIGAEAGVSLIIDSDKKTIIYAPGIMGDDWYKLGLGAFGAFAAFALALPTYRKR